ncbi:MAG: AraC family transcriptional regulator ligand-binding domain-containing protein [Burkholderiales bacterium]|nr:AraC family transcriptional regulator ligand-binding domain-containing protein [Burkholderiales bacterium]MBH2015438.1 AraC family transcriptional regulator ligand-binding domain-containing protein [Burkholderiales bacterium]
MAKSPPHIASLTFPIQYLEVGESLARELHRPPDALLRHCGVHLPRPFLPWQTMNGRQMQLALGHFLSACPPGVPPLVTFMAHFPVTAHGPVGLLAITSANLGEALQGALTYSALVMPAYVMRRQDLGDEVHLIVDPLYDFGDVSDLFTETVVAAPLKIMPFLSRPVTDVVVHLMHGPIGDPAAYEAAFGLKFVFHARQNKLVLPKHALGIPLIAPSRASHLLMRATLEQQSQARGDARPISQEVRRRLQSAIRQNRVLDVEALTQAIALSPRTLSRRLKDEGTSFPQLRAEVGVEYAEILLLETDKPISQIGQAAGFTDAAAFTRAFKRVTGLTPSQRRARPGGMAPEGLPREP